MNDKNARSSRPALDTESASRDSQGEASFEGLISFTSKPPPAADVHNRSTTVAHLPDGLLEAMRVPARSDDRKTAPDLESEARASLALGRPGPEGRPRSMPSIDVYMSEPPAAPHLAASLDELEDLGALDERAAEASRSAVDDGSLELLDAQEDAPALAARWTRWAALFAGAALWAAALWALASVVWRSIGRSP